MCKYFRINFVHKRHPLIQYCFTLFVLLEWLHGYMKWKQFLPELKIKCIFDSGGIRTHALSDWCLKPAP